MLKYTVVLIGGMFAFMALAPEPEGRIFGDKTVVSKVELVSAPVVAPTPTPVEPVAVPVVAAQAPAPVPAANRAEPRAYVAPVTRVVQIGATDAPTGTSAQSAAIEAAVLASVTISSKPVPRPDRTALQASVSVDQINQDDSNGFFPVWFVTGQRVNVRQGPSTDFAVLGKVYYGEAAEVISDSGGEWVKIRIEGDGVEGFIAKRFMSEIEPQG